MWMLLQTSGTMSTRSSGSKWSCSQLGRGFLLTLQNLLSVYIACCQASMRQLPVYAPM